MSASDLPASGAEARPAPNENVELLVELARAGDGKALTSLINRMSGDIYRLSLRMLWHPEDAEDATQEILVKVVTNLATFRGESSFRTWALRVATNHLLNVRRSRVESQELTFEAFGKDLEEGLADPADSTTAPGYEADQYLLEEEVKIGCTQAMLLCLDRSERMAYVLGDVFELESQVAGKVLGITSAAYRKRLSRARARVREFMRERCGLVNEQAPCRCQRRIPAAMSRGRIDRANLLFAGRGPATARRLPVLEAVGEMEYLHEIAAIHQSHPRYEAPERVLDSLRELLGSGKLRVLR